MQEAGARGDIYARAMNATQRLMTAGRPATDSEWEAIAARRSSPRFAFVVTSTGVICSPGCPARHPARDRIRVVASVGEGLEAGARPCLRCHPDRVAESVGTEPGRADADGRDIPAASAVDPVRSAVALLTAAIDGGDDIPTERGLAAELRIPERRLRNLFREQLGVTPMGWVAVRRAERLRSRLAVGQNVTAALYDSGYGSASAAYEAAAEHLGMAPGRFRAGAAGESIRWTIAAIPDGVALVAATDRGLCSIRLGTEAAPLEAELRAEFPGAQVARDDSALADVASLVTDLANGRRRSEADTLTLDVHATAFRRRVWEALRHIPAGETRSYGQIAAAVGAPKAARAVGSACAENPIPIVVPCHRVIGSDGSLHGYAYGLARKKQLLDAESGGA
jgi:AraC family transcriptional regulator of adaptative response/methylated-DNA-[protein]-cysteine methyltransferase